MKIQYSKTLKEMKLDLLAEIEVTTLIILIAMSVIMIMIIIMSNFYLIML